MAGARDPPGSVCRLATEPEQEPERVAEDRQRHAEMGGEPVLADIGAVHEPALHHVPAERALEASEHEQAEKPRQQRARDVAGDQKAEERHEEGKADEAAEEAMRPFPPEDGLELIEAHAALDLSVFGDLLIGGEGLLPVGLAERRDRSHDRLPFGDGEARIGEPRRPADQDHGDDEQREGGKPEPLARGHASPALHLLRRAVRPRFRLWSMTWAM